MTTGSVREVLGLVDRGVYFEVASAIAAGDGGRLLDLVANVLDEGGDLEEFVRGLVEHASHLLFTKVQGSADRLEVSEDEARRCEEAAGPLAEEDLLRIVQTLMELETEVRRSLQPRFRTELALVRLAAMGRAVDVGRLLARLSALEAAVGGGPAPAGSGARRRPAASTTAPDSGPPPPVPQPAARAEPPPGRAEPAGASPAAGGSSAAGPAEPAPGPEEAAPEEASPVASSAPAGDPEETIRGLWPQVTERMRETQPSTAGFLQDVTRLELKGSVLTLFFGEANGFAMGQVDKAAEAVAAVLAGLGGPEVRVSCKVDENSGGEGQAPDPQPTAQAPGPPSPGADLDPKLRTVLEALDGELV